MQTTRASKRGSLSLGRWALGLSCLVALVAAPGCGGDSGTTTPPADDTGTSEVLTDSTPPDSATDSSPPDADATGDDATDSAPSDGADDSTSDSPGDTAAEAEAGPPPTLSIADLTVAEGSGGATTTATFTVTLSAPATSVITVNFATADGTATTSATAVGGSDYTAATGTLTFNPGDTTQTVSVTVNGDDTDENDETFTVTLASPVGATIARATATGTITDDDAPPTLSIAAASAAEGNTGTSVISPTVTLSGASAKTVTVQYATADVVPASSTTATAGVDYTAVTATTLTFAPGETTKPAPVTILGDGTIESDETLLVDLSTPANATIATNEAVVTILNDDAAPALPTITISAPTATAEGNTGTKTFSFTVTVAGTRTGDVTVAYATSDGTATSAGALPAGGSDYLAATGTLTFTAAESTKTINVVVNGDTTWEPDETFDVTLSGATGASVTTAKATATITNDDSVPTVTINDIATNEGAAGTVAQVFTVALSGRSSVPVTVAYATADGTATFGGTAATGGLDYQKTGGTLTFPPGTLAQTVTVYVNGDTLNEVNETYSVVLSSPTNATLAAKASGTGTINNDDAAPVLTISDVKVLEGNSGTTFMAFAVNISAPSGRTVTANWATSDGTSLNPATVAGNDYVAGSGTVTFAPGDTAAKAITVSVKGDTVTEASETLNVTLSAPVGATISGTGVAVGTIINDDGTATFINIANGFVTEGNTGTTTTMTFTVTLSAPVPAGKTYTVNYATAPYPSTLTGAIAGTDYLAKTGTVTFPAGSTSQNVTITVIGDSLYEYNEYFYVNLSNGSVGTEIQDGQAYGVIYDDDVAPVASIAPVASSVSEGAAGTTKTVTFTVTLSTASARNTYVNYATADGTAQAGGTLVAGGADYVTASAQLIFAPGETSKTFTVTINGDATYEPNETFTAALSGAANVSISPSAGTATVTITNDDTVPVASIANVSMNEGTPPAGGTLQTPMGFTITLSNPSSLTVSISARTVAGTACSPFNASCLRPDYTTLPVTAYTFAPGTTTATFNVLVNGDAIVEANETFTVPLSVPVNATLSATAAIATGTIVNDD
jgi:hypothetical protein